ncbi:MAG: polyribonucleotide nucleotidyltransferase [Candidatus Colwellbacteria bacterium CG10_big_fil_rev_8_21_14_0_10_42_22]|uniref:Polyribonucleotide nucleotidyltransferase n=1 Tax=Candidatus Colwellbacteria bacterium CG10_big_fil_rev_8_21_14_0_10_42_22 TaxID=1974540 RepID=A0A2H0VG17_9BACT|nr:MAG: polyribonucleotide nucleotidyltransferase [Candidatus Colwellbacteria bacterium CG10_big_fil_rev_8_21_14_0_10_42_22]
MDLNRKKFTKEIAGRELVLEVSGLAGQTNGAVIGTYGETTVLVTVVMSKDNQDLDYLPLSVDYEEKNYAAGKILGGRFMKREGRPSEEAVLSGRLVDRVIRPLFNKRIRRGIQVVATILSYDGENDPDFVTLMTASAALSISDIPWDGPVAGIRIAKLGEEFVINPVNSQIEIIPGQFDAFIAGTKDRVNMIELGGNETKEEDVLKACEIALEHFKELTVFQQELMSAVGKEKIEVKLDLPSEKLVETAKEFLKDKLDEAAYVDDKKLMSDNLAKLKLDLEEHLISAGYEEKELKYAEYILEEELDRVVHKNALENDRRPDGRAFDEVRPLYSEISLFPRMHGSGLFARGDTQALAVTTLGPPGDEQLMETIEFSGKRRFLLHYNFPPFSVGEARSFRGPGRRDIGHGALAKKALEPLVPSKDQFPYTIRVVSEILSSNGSSSMATVSAASMSMMDAGIPLKEPAAGIAMGLILGGDGSYKILTDIQGPEDHYGDMDFKVAGTKSGVNAVQLDVKIDGLTPEIIRETLERARAARLHILDFTAGVIEKPRAELSSYAPRILTTQISPDKIGELIGPGGKVINGLIEETGVDSIDIDDDGTVFITSADANKAEDALAKVEAMMKEFVIGEIVEGKVAKILEFGAIVEFPGGKSGMIHVSELKEGFVKNVEDVVKVGDLVKAKIIGMENGRTALSIKQLPKD